jgi:hypothetical protein
MIADEMKIKYIGLLFAVYSSPFTIYRSLFTIHCLPLLLYTVHCFPPLLLYSSTQRLIDS